MERNSDPREITAMTDTILMRLDRRLAALGMTDAQACRLAGVKRDIIRDLRRAVGRGRPGTLRAENAQKIARALQTNPEWLLYGRGKEIATDNFNDEVSQQTIIPDFLTVVGEAGSGIWKTMDDYDFKEYQTATLKPPGYRKDAIFGLQVRGNSINRIAHDGNLAVCVQIDNFPRPPQNGDWVVVQRYDGNKIETTIKRLEGWPGAWSLAPYSDDPRWQQSIKIADDKYKITAIVLQFMTVATRP
jgi:hypothetical protein